MTEVLHSHYREITVTESNILSLLDEAELLLEIGEYNRAMKLSKHLGKFYSGGFDVGARVLQAKGEVEKAVRYLKKGNDKYPDCWLLLQLQGNLQSDLARFDEALKSYEKATHCEDTDLDSIYLNQAIVFERMGYSDKALDCLERIEAKRMLPRKLCLQMSVYRESGDTKKCLETANSVDWNEIQEVFETWLEDGIDPGYWHSRLHVEIARALHSEKDTKPAIESALEAARILPLPENLGLLRQVRDQVGDQSKVFSLGVEANLKEPGGEDFRGFYQSALVVAESQEEGLGYIQELNLDSNDLEFKLEDVEILDEAAGSLKGVYDLSGRVFFTESYSSIQSTK